MESITINTPEKVTGTGLYDNGSYAEKYDKTEHYEVSLSFHYGITYVNYTTVLNNQVRRGITQAPLSKITDPEILEAVKKILK